MTGGSTSHYITAGLSERAGLRKPAQGFKRAKPVSRRGKLSHLAGVPETLSSLLSLALCGRSAVVWWLVFPPVTRKTRAQFPAIHEAWLPGVFGPPLASGGLFLDLLWFWGLVFGPALATGGSCLDLLWLPGARFWTSSGFGGLAFGPPLASGRSFLDLRWVSSGFRGAHFWISSGSGRSFLDLCWLPGACFWTSYMASGVSLALLASGGPFLDSSLAFCMGPVFGPPLASFGHR